MTEKKDPSRRSSKPASIVGAKAQLLEQARGRLVLVAMVLMMGYLAIGLRMADLALLHRSQAAADAGGRERDLKPSGAKLRAAITDRTGALMATSLRMASVYADTALIDNPAALARDLARILPEQSEKEILRKLSSGKRFIWIQRNVTPKQEYAVNALGNPALGFQPESRRIYPNASLAAHIVGYTDVDGNGIAGVEKFFDKRLTEDEKPVRLTIDLRVQHILHRELKKSLQKFRAKGAVGMVMDVATGEIIAMVSLPDFDPNRPSEASDDRKFNRASLGVFEMGSTFKLFSTAAALDSGRVTFGSTFDATTPIKIGRFTISDFHAKRRPLTVPEIFIYSSNIGTAKMAATLGPDGLRKFYKSLGFMEAVPIELPERGTPLYPNPWREISTLTTSFGHGIAVSPVHLMRAAAGLVNGGLLPIPTLVMREEGAPPAPTDRVVSAKTSDQLRRLLELVVTDGTGNNAWVEGYDVGGKTGTAEKNTGGRYERNALLSSFLGVFPIRNPRYAVLAMLDEPQGTQDTHGYATGGWTAAPVVASVVEYMGPLYRIPPDKDRPRNAIEKEMAIYLKELKEGKGLASAGTDH